MITKVVYARLFNLGNYENERIEVEATIGDGESPAEAFENLRRYTDAQHEQFQEARQQEQLERERKWREERRAEHAARQQPAIVDKVPDDIF